MSSKTKKHQSALHKKSYSSPSLTYFGAIKELTSGGASGGKEGKDMDPADCNMC
jgi:hypothetical protein